MGTHFIKLDPEICCVYAYLIYNCPSESNEFDIRRDYKGVVRKDMFYIGQIHSPNPDKLRLRHKEHMRKSRVKQKVDFFLHTHKYELFHLWFGFKEDVDAMERYFITLFDSFNELNLESGGSIIKTCSNETRQKLSQASKAYWNCAMNKERRREILLEYWSNPEVHILRSGENSPLFGKKRTDEHKKKISDANKRKWQNPEYRKEHLQYLSVNWEREWTDEERKKCSEKSKELWADPVYRSKHEGKNHHFYGKPASTFYQSKRVGQYNEEGILLNIYDSLTDASKAVGVCKHSIYAAVDKDGRKCKGYIWKTLNTNDVDNDYI